MIKGHVDGENWSLTVSKVSERRRFSVSMADTRSKSLFAEAMVREVDETFGSGIDKLEETIADQNAKIGERIHALLLLLRSRNAEEENLQVNARPASPQIPAFPDSSRPKPKPNYVIKTDTEISQVSSLSNLTTSKNKLIPMKYSCEEINKRREAGLCIFCDEQETLDHHLKHKGLRIVMMDLEDASMVGVEEKEALSDSVTASQFQDIKGTQQQELISDGLVQKAILEEESIPQFQVPIANSEILRSCELREVKLELEKLEYVVMDKNLENEWVQKGTTKRFEVEGDVERSQKVLSIAKNCYAHQVFGKMSQHKERLGTKKKTKWSKTWWFKFKELVVRQEDIQNVLLAFLHTSIIETGYITTFKHVRMRLIRQTHMSRRGCEVWLIQTLNDLQQFTLGEVMFQIKHKWRVKLLHLVSEFEFSFESVALSDEQFSVEKTLVHAAGTCGEDLQQLARVLDNCATQKLFTSRNIYHCGQGKIIYKHFDTSLVIQVHENHVIPRQKNKFLTSWKFRCNGRDVLEEWEIIQGDYGHYFLLIAAANGSMQIHFRKASNHVWHRWKARCSQNIDLDLEVAAYYEQLQLFDGVVVNVLLHHSTDLFIRLQSTKEKRKCPKSWVFKFRTDKKIAQRLGLIVTYLENKKNWRKLRVKNRDNLSWQEASGDENTKEASGKFQQFRGLCRELMDLDVSFEMDYDTQPPRLCRGPKLVARNAANSLYTRLVLNCSN